MSKNTVKDIKLKKVSPITHDVVTAAIIENQAIKHLTESVTKSIETNQKIFSSSLKASSDAVNTVNDNLIELVASIENLKIEVQKNNTYTKKLEKKFCDIQHCNKKQQKVLREFADKKIRERERWEKFWVRILNPFRV